MWQRQTAVSHRSVNKFFWFLRCVGLPVGSAAPPMELTEEKMPIALLYALGFFFFGVGEFLQGVATLIDTEVVRKYFEGNQGQVAQGQPLLTEDAEMLYADFGWRMDLQNKLTVLRREILKLPSLPDEGH
jgi:hypothetical protein